MVSYCGRSFTGISLQLTLPRDGGVLHWAEKDTWTDQHPSVEAALKVKPFIRHLGMALSV